MVVPAGRSHHIMIASMAVAAVALFILAAVSLPLDAHGEDAVPVQCPAEIPVAGSDDGPSGGSSIEHAGIIALFIAGAGTVLAVLSLIRERGRGRR